MRLFFSGFALSACAPNPAQSPINQLLEPAPNLARIVVFSAARGVGASVELNSDRVTRYELRPGAFTFYDVPPGKHWIGVRYDDFPSSREVRASGSIQKGETIYLYFKVTGLPSITTSAPHPAVVSYELLEVTKEDAARMVRF